MKLFASILRFVTALCLFSIAVPLALNSSAAIFTNSESTYVSCDWESEDGLPNDAINAVMQSRDGYFWIGTREGLLRFDGVRFATVPLDCFRERRNPAISLICETHDGTLWLATEDGRLCGIKSGKSFDVALPNSVTNGILTRLYEDKAGALWIGTETNGLLRFAKGTFSRFTVADGLGHNSIRSMCEDGSGNLWIATAGGLTRLKDGVFNTMTTADGLLHNSIRAVYFDRHGNLWIASHYGLTRMRDDVMTHFRKRDGLSDNLISSILEDQNGVLWVGTFNGLNRLENEKLFTENRADGTSYDRINSIFEDHEGNLWIGMRNGLSRLKPRVVTSYTEQQGLTYNNASSLIEDVEGNLWVTFWGGGINRIRNGVVTPFRRSQGLSSDLVLTAHQTRGGELWFGMDYDGGLNLFRDGKFIHYRELEGMTDHSVRAIFDDRVGNLWIGTRTALLRFKDGQFHRYTTSEGLPSDSIISIHEDRKGRLWFGTEGGLVIFENGTFHALPHTQEFSNEVVNSIYEDADETVWLGTRSGLHRLRNGKISSFGPQTGIDSDEIYCVLDDDHGRLWLSSRRGVFCVSKNELNDVTDGTREQLHCVSFGKRDGMASIECRGYGNAAGWKTRDGRLWFPTSKGIISVNPRAAKLNTIPPTVMLESLQINSARVDISHPVKLVARQTEFIFHYTALSFSAPEKLVFRYKLEGLDKGWVEAGALREARYTHLPPGRYRFRVIAANGDGFWNEEGSSLALVLLPPWWQTWWFRCLAGLLLVGSVAGIVRYVSIQKLHRQLAALEQQHAVEKERARIAKDMHDDLGANLTQICILSELAKREAAEPHRVQSHADAIANTARELVQSMDEIVWSANPKNDNLRKLAGYIFQYAEHFLSPTQIRGRFEHPVSLPDRPLGAEVRHNVFLVVKEALNNAVKHSGASEVWLRIGVVDEKLEIRIEDNGKGFAQANGRAFGNGLSNMRKRITDISGTFEMQSAPVAGTKIKIVVAMPTES